VSHGFTCNCLLYAVIYYGLSMGVLGCDGVVVSSLDFRSEGRWFEAQLPAIVLFPLTRNFTPHCLSPRRCINGYRRHTAGGNPAMDYHPVQGGVALLSVASCYGNRDKPPWLVWNLTYLWA